MGLDLVALVVTLIARFTITGTIGVFEPVPSADTTAGVEGESRASTSSAVCGESSDHAIVLAGGSEESNVILSMLPCILRDASRRSCVIGWRGVEGLTRS